MTTNELRYLVFGAQQIAFLAALPFWELVSKWTCEPPSVMFNYLIELFLGLTF